MRAYKSKLIFGLSVRQLAAIIGALAVGVPLGVFGRGHIPNDILIWLVMLVVVPFAGWGFLTIQDLRFEDYVRIFLRFVFLPQKRVYEDTETNLFVNLKEEILEKTIITQRREAGEYERTGR
ncbi:MAG: PrgI family protein [Oscillospiraceae bacterium]|nr:PrgI family protein [Oscillospiraceae bacterium]